MRRSVLPFVFACWIASYICFGLFTLYWFAIHGGEEFKLLPLLVFAPISFPVFSLFALRGMFSLTLTRDGLVWPILMGLYIPIFFFFFGRTRSWFARRSTPQASA
jgi:hypothetical protein